MTIYIDDFRMRSTVGRINSRWSHLTADTKQELHTFAAKLGLKLEWFQDKGNHLWHYDVTDGKRDLAIKLGAMQVTARFIATVVCHKPGREGLRETRI